MDRPDQGFLADGQHHETDDFESLHSHMAPPSPSRASIGHSLAGRSSSAASAASERPPLLSPEPTYKAHHSQAGPTTPHYVDYPMSVRDRQRMTDDLAEDEEDASHQVALPSVSSAAAQQRQMLSQTLTQGSRSELGTGSTLRTEDIYALDVEEEAEAAPKFPIRTALLAMLLLVVGLTCLIIGLVHIATNGAVFAFVLIGGLLIIPGGYQCWSLWNAWRRVPGFSFAQLTAYE